MCVCICFSPIFIKTASAQAAESSPEMKKADSLYTVKDWANAKIYYQKSLRGTSKDGFAWNRLGFSYFNTGDLNAAIKAFDKALLSNPAPPVKASVYSRMARINAAKKNNAVAYANIDSALNSGYNNFAEMDSVREFESMRNDEKFKAFRTKAYGFAYPCMVDKHAREFDFWVGEWTVYASGTKTNVGHSIIQRISEGCSILENWFSNGVAFNGKSLNFVDPSTNKWKQRWIGSDGAVREFVNGEYKDGAMRYTFETTDAQNHKLSGRFTFFNVGPDEVRQVKETSADEGKTWQTVYDFRYERIKK
jgi:hypothetical protein